MVSKFRIILWKQARFDAECEQAIRLGQSYRVPKAKERRERNRGGNNSAAPPPGGYATASSTLGQMSTSQMMLFGTAAERK